MLGDNLLRILLAFSQVLGKNALPVGAEITGRVIVIMKHFLVCGGRAGLGGARTHSYAWTEHYR